jgi:hypothetical protein
MGPSVVWHVAGSLAGMSAAAVLIAGCSVIDSRVDPEPTTVTQTLPPIVGDPWWRTDLPVDGVLESLGAPTTGDVAMVRDGIASVRITITGFTTREDGAPDLRVLLAAGDVTRRSNVDVFVSSGDSVEVGSFDAAAGTVVVEFENPQILPFEIHSLVLLDPRTGTRLAAAELVPSG